MIVLIRGGGDLASGVALRLHRAGLRVVVAELAQPLAIRRLVSFAEAIYAGEISIEGVIARRVADAADTLRILQIFAKGQIPVLVDPQADSVKALHPTVVVDARMMKHRADLISTPVNLIVGLGPGFTVGENCHAVVETQRGHYLGRVYWQGGAQPNTGVPDPVRGQSAQRVLRAPLDGVLEGRVAIGEHVAAGQPVAEVAGQPVLAPFAGVLRGLLHSGVPVVAGLKIGDVDPRDDPAYCTLVSEKSLAVGGGVLEAILSRPELRPNLWS
jgi:xanthine dehydrogenase accessory factor